MSKPKYAKKYTTPVSETHPDLPKSWSKKNTILPTSVTAGSTKKVWWTCDKGHEWEAVIANRVSGRGCPYCANKKVLPGYNDLATTRPDLLQIWSTKNTINPTEVTSKSAKRVLWTCKLGHEWESIISNIAKGKGCPYCAGSKVLSGFNDLATTHPEMLLFWSDSNKISPQEISIGSEKKILWRCGNSHEWYATPRNKSTSKKSGCPYCTGQKAIIGVNDLVTVRPDLVLEWSDKNRYTPFMYMEGSRSKVWWVCSKGHEWETRVSHRAAGHGCPSCCFLSSKPENALLKTISEFGLDIDSHKPIKYVNHRMIVDGLISGKNSIVVEYDGEYWHRPTKIVAKDTIKTEHLLQQNYLVVRVREGALPFLDIKHKNLLQVRNTDEDTERMLEWMQKKMVAS